MSDRNDDTERRDSQHPDLSALTGSYALGALDADDLAAFEAHLPDHDDVRSEATELSDTAVLLGLAVPPQAPPPALKANIMAQLDATPQLAAEPAPSYSAAGAFGPAAIGPAERKARSRWARPVVSLASAAAVIGLLAGGGIVATTMFQNGQQQEQADLFAAINAASDVQRKSVELPSGTATLVWSNELLASALITDGLEALPASQVYELWYIGESGPRSAGTFTADGSRIWRVLEGEMRSGDVVGVTVEPRGGSEQPTTDPIVVIESA
ncbi:anti-sigma-K factor RskA [Microbacteriaceae bacterium SG_E_30_P1]|uniref:Regulator of SigK n=1 Tax=Antiquaquibacter oligotrophicus TaxID=2880260 RepID=A0ABT6KJC9_9MICO|nr:anti-sigma factor [Antiquaquibacter oligotrophicus]MDH6180051.1 anti-sigma-K factor RskA [Antiquaquibacter oligotrophicus]UDF14196.1 anti-sigma factor [Antiquaquibacter oligotrophicus]